MASRYEEAILSNENLVWAWKKVRRLYVQADGPVDFTEIVAFELDLDAQLKTIRTDLAQEKFALCPLKLLPQPKKPSESGIPRMRESFHIAVRDQVAWTAVINVIGPELDSRMPKWSYGHRLYKAAWYEQTQFGKNRHLSLGPYRHSTGNLYRKFKHSWPLFRRHISLTARIMTAGTATLDQILEDADEAERAAHHVDGRPEYLNRDHWPPLEAPTLYYASLDLEKFYPSIKQRAILKAISTYLPSYADDRWLKATLKSLLNFNVDPECINLVDTLNVDPPTAAGKYDGIPTGLMVAGFLSNIAMMPLDDAVNEKLSSVTKAERKIAHLRFVDDHSIVASDFSALIEWIKWYKGQLDEIGVGPKVAPKKYDPPQLVELIEATDDQSLIDQIRRQCEIDGSNPSKLLTRTLALVSTLAGTDFDTISDHTRQQRLDELTWLLLADLPDAEIRSDTRVAFAAGRITSIVPGLQIAGERVLHWSRELSEANALKDKKRITLAENELKIWRLAETEDHKKFRAKYFRLLLKAFFEHPEKPRLFLQLLRYCHRTGHNGYTEIFEWLLARQKLDQGGLSAYLRILALQSISKHALESAHACTSHSKLHKQRKAALSDLRNIANLDVVARPTTGLLKHGLWRHSLKTFGAALRGSAEIVRRTNRSIAISLDESADSFKVPDFDDATMEWFRSTGYPIGVWTHLMSWGSKSVSFQPSIIWVAAKKHHNPFHVLDWNSLRQFPTRLPANTVKYVKEIGDRLAPDDAGWLLDFVMADEDFNWLKSRRGEPYSSVRKHLTEVRSNKHVVTLSEWVDFLNQATPGDPRASEWTALEVIRKVVDKTGSFGASLHLLDDLHPSNIFVPKRWMRKSLSGTANFWTWEGWRREIGRRLSTIEFATNRVQDYRRASEEFQQDAWDSRFRGLGLLLFGLLRRDFSLPPAWNVRGNERDIVPFVNSELEALPVSSFTHAILDSALLPRSIENRLIVRMPEFFFGDAIQSTIADTTSDAPIIKGPDQLLEWIDRAQGTLRGLQISVLDHAPRQLVPMSVMQLKQVAIPVDENN